MYFINLLPSSKLSSTTYPLQCHLVGSCSGRKNRLRAVFSFLGISMKLETIVYIDGYNLYYGSLKKNGGVDYKWLDIYKLFSKILNEQDPNSEIVKVKYFTAPALGKFARHGNKSAEAQQTYHRALKHLYPDLIEIINGSQTCVPKPLPEYNDNIPFDKNKRQWVWVLEEKMTDVEIALAMYRDALQENCKQIVLCSNDSDMKPALQAIKSDIPTVIIGIVMPIIPKLKNKKNARRISGSLDELSHWTRDHILLDELEKSQLPNKIPTNKKPVIRPDHW